MARREVAGVATEAVGAAVVEGDEGSSLRRIQAPKGSARPGEECLSAWEAPGAGSSGLVGLAVLRSSAGGDGGREGGRGG
ncbi:MAG: hypothetical protein IPN17_32850 [Deltaproteobacteria bacterium]|nr:hypothetical protein [Deltaproteobacteria bacterium]